MDDGREWDAVCHSIAADITEVINRRLSSFRPVAKAFLERTLNPPISANWRSDLAAFVQDTNRNGLEIAPHSIAEIQTLIEDQFTEENRGAAEQSATAARTHAVVSPPRPARSVVPHPVASRSSPPLPPRLTPAVRLVNAGNVQPGDYTAAMRLIIETIGPDWRNVTTRAMSRVRAAGGLIDEHTGAALGHDANSLGVETFVRLQRNDGGVDTAHFRFVWPWFSPPHWEFVGLTRGAAPEQAAAALAAQQKIRHADVMRVRGAINRAQGGMFAVIGGIDGIAEGALLLGTLEMAAGAEQLALAGGDLASEQAQRAWSARGIQAFLEAGGVDPETAQFLAENGGLLIALGRATVDASRTAHAVIETSTGYRIRLEFDPATLSANGFGGAKIKATKLTAAGLPPKTVGKAAATPKRREAYVGRNPRKNSRTGREVIERMASEGKLRWNSDGKAEVRYIDPATGAESWHPLESTDMGHLVDVVKHWNAVGRPLGEKHSEIRKWMLDSKNYELEPSSVNRSRGAQLQDEYLPPIKGT